MSRGTGKQEIFLCDADRVYFLRILEHVVLNYQWVCHAYCLLNNHYHLVLETPASNLAVGMHYLNSVFSIFFNKSHRKVGHVMQGRYCSKVLEDDDHYLTVFRYVSLNASKDGFCESPADWPWGSYRYYMGLQGVPDLLNQEFSLEMFASSGEMARPLMRHFVESTDDHELPVPYEELGALEAELENDKSYCRARRDPLLVYFNQPCCLEDRNKAILAATRAGYSKREIAGFLGMDRSSVSKIIKLLGGNPSP
jgi:putative transposase